MPMRELLGCLIKVFSWVTDKLGLNKDEVLNDRRVGYLLRFQDDLRQLVDASELVESIDDVGRFVGIITELMKSSNVKYKQYVKPSYDGQLLSKLADVLVYGVKDSVVSSSSISDIHSLGYFLHLEEESSSEKNRDRSSSLLDIYLKMREIEVSGLREELKLTGGVRKVLSSAGLLNYHEEGISTLLSFHSLKQSEILLLICNRIAIMKTTELVRFLELGRLISGNMNFIFDFIDFIRDDVMVTINRSLKLQGGNIGSEKLMTEEVGDYEIRFGGEDKVQVLDDKVEVLNDSDSDNTDGDANGLFDPTTLYEIITPKTIKILNELRILNEDMRKCTCIGVTKDNKMHITITGVSPNEAGLFLMCMKEKMGSNVPIHEICFKSITFKDVDSLSKISHSIVESAESIRFDSCSFRNDTLDLDPRKVTLEYLENVKELSIVNCNIKALFSLEIVFKGLEILNIRNHALNEIPSCVFELENLTGLSITCGKLCLVQHHLSRLQNLKILRLSYNKLPCFPSVITKMIKLECLDLAGSDVTGIASSMNNLENLMDLCLENCVMSKGDDVSLSFRLPKLRMLLMRGSVAYDDAKTPECNKATSVPMYTCLFGTDISKSLPDLEELDLSNSQLEVFPKDILSLSKLKRLIFWQGMKFDAKSIDDAFEGVEAPLPMLESLLLQEFELGGFPLGILKLTNLKELFINKCEIKSVPDDIALLTNLTRLSLRDNGLNVFPSGVSELENLTYLSLGSNKDIVTLKGSDIYKLRNLKSLAMGNCGLKGALSGDICKLVNLENLDLSGNRGLILPVLTKQLKKLTSLCLSGVGMVLFDDGILDATNLNTLDISNNKLQLLPSEMVALKNLKALYVQNNGLTKTGISAVCGLTSLEILNISDTEIPELPEDFSKLQNLKKLLINKNMLTEFPSALSDFTSLEHLEISNNPIRSFRSDLRKLVNLKVLNILGNNLSSFPEMISDLPSLEQLYIDYSSNRFMGWGSSVMAYINTVRILHGRKGLRVNGVLTC